MFLVKFFVTPPDNFNIYDYVIFTSTTDRVTISVHSSATLVDSIWLSTSCLHVACLFFIECCKVKSFGERCSYLRGLPLFIVPQLI